MFDIINGYAGIIFGLIITAVALLPIMALAETIGREVLKYATASDEDYKSWLFEWVNFEGKRIHNDPWIGFIAAFAWFGSIVGTIISMVYTCDHGITFREGLFHVFVETGTTIGTYLSEFLLIGGAIYGLLKLSRTSFKVKHKLEAHIKDKEKHNG